MTLPTLTDESILIALSVLVPGAMLAVLAQLGRPEPEAL